MLVMMSSISVSICYRFYTKAANSGKITFFRNGCTFFYPSFKGTPLPSGMKFCLEILEALGYHMVKTESLYLTRA